MFMGLNKKKRRKREEKIVIYAIILCKNTRVERKRERKRERETKVAKLKQAKLKQIVGTAKNSCLV